MIILTKQKLFKNDLDKIISLNNVQKVIKIQKRENKIIRTISKNNKIVEVLI